MKNRQDLLDKDYLFSTREEFDNIICKTLGIFVDGGADRDIYAALDAGHSVLYASGCFYIDAIKDDAHMLEWAMGEDEAAFMTPDSFFFGEVNEYWLADHKVSVDFIELQQLMTAATDYVQTSLDASHRDSLTYNQPILQADLENYLADLKSKVAAIVDAKYAETEAKLAPYLYPQPEEAQ